jgi:hypothetical protein
MNFLFGLLLFGAAPALAQSPYSRIELGAQTSVMTGNYDSGLDSDFGFGGRFTYNFSRYIALDTQLDFYPSQHRSLNLQEGGQRFAGFVGIKAGWRRDRFGLFWKARPGFLSFSDVPQLGVAGAFDRQTHFALDLGGVIEIYPTPRTILRFDVGTLLARYGERTLPIGSSAFLSAPGSIASFLNVSAGFSYRIGRSGPPPRSSSQEQFRKFEIGGQFGWLGIPGAGTALRDEPGYGGRFTYNLFPWLAAEARITYFYSGRDVIDVQEGGKILQGFFGPKLGIRRQNFGAFIKLEPGFTSYGQTLSDFRNFPQPPIPYQRLTHFSFDTGAVFEYYPSSHTVVRFDAGAIEVFYGARDFQVPQGTGTASSYRKIGMAVSTSFAWRF